MCSSSSCCWTPVWLTMSNYGEENIALNFLILTSRKVLRLKNILKIHVRAATVSNESQNAQQNSHKFKIIRFWNAFTKSGAGKEKIKNELSFCFKKTFFHRFTAHRTATKPVERSVPSRRSRSTRRILRNFFLATIEVSLLCGTSPLRPLYNRSVTRKWVWRRRSKPQRQQSSLLGQFPPYWVSYYWAAATVRTLQAED